MDNSRFNQDIEQNSADMSRDQKHDVGKKKVLIVGAGAAG